MGALPLPGRRRQAGAEHRRSHSTINVYNDVRARGLADRVVQPVREPGVEKMRVSGAAVSDPLVITKDEVREISLAAETTLSAEGVTILSDRTRETVLSILLAPLQDPERLKWKFTEGQGEIWAKVLDRRFITDLVNHDQHLAIGDKLHCELRQVRL